MARPLSSFFLNPGSPRTGRCPWGGSKSRLEDSSPGYVNSGPALAIGILDGVKAQPGDVVFIGQTISSLVQLVEIPPIEPGTMATKKDDHGGRLAHSRGGCFARFGAG